MKRLCGILLILSVTNSEYAMLPVFSRAEIIAHKNDDTVIIDKLCFELKSVAAFGVDIAAIFASQEAEHGHQEIDEVVGAYKTLIQHAVADDKGPLVVTLAELLAVHPWLDGQGCFFDGKTICFYSEKEQLNDEKDFLAIVLEAIKLKKIQEDQARKSEQYKRFVEHYYQRRACE